VSESVLLVIDVQVGNVTGDESAWESDRLLRVIGGLVDEARGRHAERLVICGLQSEYCVDTTTRRAFSLGYDITLVADGHSTCAGSLTAAQKIAHHNEVLGGWFARVVPASQVWA